MILKQKPIKVLLKDESGEAIFVFAEPRLNRELELRALLKKGFSGPEDERAFFSLILQDLQSIEGLKDEAGNAISTDQFKDLDLPLETIQALVIGRAAAINERNKKEEPEKNEQAA